ENHLPLIPRRPRPWAIWLADAETGEGRELWHSGKEMNDSLPPRAADSLKFAEAGKIVFSSEQDGLSHLYLVSTATGKTSLLTPGGFDVEDVELAPDNSTLLYTSNAADVDRRHISQILLKSFDLETKAGAATSNKSVTSGATIEWRPLMLADGKTIVCLGSS